METVRNPGKNLGLAGMCLGPWLFIDGVILGKSYRCKWTHFPHFPEKCCELQWKSHPSELGKCFKALFDGHCCFCARCWSELSLSPFLQMKTSCAGNPALIRRAGTGSGEENAERDFRNQLAQHFSNLLYFHDFCHDLCNLCTTTDTIVSFNTTHLFYLHMCREEPLYHYCKWKTKATFHWKNQWKAKKKYSENSAMSLNSM